MWLIYLQVLKQGQRCKWCRKNGINNVFKVKQTTSKVLILLCDRKAHLQRYNQHF